MATATYDTQQGITMTLSVDSLTLRLTNTGALRKVLIAIRTTYLGSTTKHTYIPGELADFPPIPVTYQNSPGIALPTNVVQTITFTMPTATGMSVPESVTGSAFIMENDMTPAMSSDSEGLQMKSILIKFDGVTGPTHAIGS